MRVFFTKDTLGFCTFRAKRFGSSAACLSAAAASKVFYKRTFAINALYKKMRACMWWTIGISFTFIICCNKSNNIILLKHHNKLCTKYKK
jgi:hypothetical protein